MAIIIIIHETQTRPCRELPLNLCSEPTYSLLAFVPAVLLPVHVVYLLLWYMYISCDLDYVPRL